MGPTRFKFKIQTTLGQIVRRFKINRISAGKESIFLRRKSTASGDGEVRFMVGLT